MHPLPPTRKARGGLPPRGGGRRCAAIRRRGAAEHPLPATRKARGGLPPRGGGRTRTAYSSPPVKRSGTGGGDRRAARPGGEGGRTSASRRGREILERNAKKRLRKRGCAQVGSGTLASSHRGDPERHRERNRETGPRPGGLGSSDLRTQGVGARARSRRRLRTRPSYEGGCLSHPLRRVVRHPAAFGSHGEAPASQRGALTGFAAVPQGIAPPASGSEPATVHPDGRGPRNPERVEVSAEAPSGFLAS